MRIRLTTDRAGPTGFHVDGDVIDLPREEALRLVLARQAELIDHEEALHGAAMTAEYAAKPRQAPRRK